MLEQKLYDTLLKLQIKFEKVEHEAFATCEASENFYEKNNLGVDCKNVFLRNKRGKKHYLVILPAEKQIDIPILAEFLEEHRNMGFASNERLEKFLGLKPGSVTPFAIIHENSQEIPVIIDSEIFDHKFVHFHPMRNTATLKITTKDFKKFLDHHPNEVLEFEF